MVVYDGLKICHVLLYILTSIYHRVKHSSPLVTSACFLIKKKLLLGSGDY